MSGGDWVEAAASKGCDDSKFLRALYIMVGISPICLLTSNRLYPSAATRESRLWTLSNITTVSLPGDILCPLEILSEVSQAAAMPVLQPDARRRRVEYDLLNLVLDMALSGGQVFSHRMRSLACQWKEEVFSSDFHPTIKHISVVYGAEDQDMEDREDREDKMDEDYEQVGQDEMPLPHVESSTRREGMARIEEVNDVDPTVDIVTNPGHVVRAPHTRIRELARRIAHCMAPSSDQQDDREPFDFVERLQSAFETQLKEPSSASHGPQDRSSLMMDDASGGDNLVQQIEVGPPVNSGSNGNISPQVSRTASSSIGYSGRHSITPPASERKSKRRRTSETSMGAETCEGREMSNGRASVTKSLVRDGQATGTCGEQMHDTSTDVEITDASGHSEEGGFNENEVQAESTNNASMAAVLSGAKGGGSRHNDASHSAHSKNDEDISMDSAEGRSSPSESMTGSVRRSQRLLSAQTHSANGDGKDGDGKEVDEATDGNSQQKLTADEEGDEEENEQDAEEGEEGEEGGKHDTDEGEQDEEEGEQDVEEGEQSEEEGEEDSEYKQRAKQVLVIDALNPSGTRHGIAYFKATVRSPLRTYSLCTIDSVLRRSSKICSCK